MLKGLIGKKIGMTQIFDETGAAVPVTLIEAGPCFVTQVRLPETEGYAAVQLGFGEVKTQAPDWQASWGISRRTNCLRCVFCVNSA